MDEEPRTLEVGEELVAEADARARALDQPRHVDDRELAAVRRLDSTERRLHRRERVVGHLRRRIRDASEERGLAGVRQPGERGVRDELQPQVERAGLPRKAGLGKARRLPRRRGEPSVAAAAPPAGRNGDAQAGCREVGDQRALLRAHLRPDRDSEVGIVAVRPVPPAATAVSAAGRREERPTAERREVSERRVCDENDIPAAPAVAPVGTALRDVLLATESQRAVSAPAGADDDAGTVVEHEAGRRPAREPRTSPPVR